MTNHPRILVAGIGNIFLGDDAFGVEVAQRLARRPQSEGVSVVDFGVRGFDLAYALMDSWNLAILVDATPRGGLPGTLYVIEPDLNDVGEPGTTGMAVETHGLNPMKVFQLVRALGGEPPPIRVVGCEPASLGSDEEPAMGMSEPVQAAVTAAIPLVESLIQEQLDGRGSGGSLRQAAEASER